MNSRADSHRAVAIIGIVALLLFLSLTHTHAETDNVEITYVSNVYNLSREYYTFTTKDTVLGVKITLELDVPKIFINGENNTIIYRVLVGNAPSGWYFNITKLIFEGLFCIQRSVQSPALVLRDNESFTSQFIVKIETQLEPGFYDRCSIYLVIYYSARYRENREDNRLGDSTMLVIKSRELPLELKPNISANVEYGKYIIFTVPVLHLYGQLRVKNIHNWNITLTRAYICRFSKPGDLLLRGLDCERERDLPSIVIRPGEEYVLSVDERISRYSPPWDVVFIIEYLYPGGKAQNWAVFKVAGGLPTATAQLTKSSTTTIVARTPTTTTTTTLTTIPTATITKTEATATRATRVETIVLTATTPMAGASSGDFTLTLILVPIVVAAATATVFAVRWLRKAPT